MIPRKSGARRPTPSTSPRGYTSRALVSVVASDSCPRSFWITRRSARPAHALAEHDHHLLGDARAVADERKKHRPLTLPSPQRGEGSGAPAAEEREELDEVAPVRGDGVRAEALLHRAVLEKALVESAQPHGVPGA